ncbi:BRI1-KD interacting protein [Striga asiatica]|uniref:BRI1-KD interacting protein n=1 Tax=Striga asiatica TaxID=4170 RepID=A0A5A7RDD8_STRAF|nr:BRI1-KD interacting protein [Striga asiatica]
MHSVPSNDLLLSARPHVSSFYGGSSFHRLKHLQKSDRRALSAVGSTSSFRWDIVSSILFVARALGSIKMEVSVPGNTSHYLDSCCGSLTAYPHDLIHNDSENLSMSDLKTCLTELSNIEETRISTSGCHLSPEKNCIRNVGRESDCEDLSKSVFGSLSAGKCISKCATFPPVHEPKSTGDVTVGEKGKHVGDTTVEASDGNGSAKPACYARSTSLPSNDWGLLPPRWENTTFLLFAPHLEVPLKLVSSLKGSREKREGTSPKNLSVTWAPDVYDPIPTSVSHVPTDKNQRYRNSSKKSGKYKQRSSGKSSRGGRSKDNKKQTTRKSSSGSTSKSSSNGKLKQPFHMGGGGVVLGGLDYNVGGPDPFCGSSFSEGVGHQVAFSCC